MQKTFGLAFHHQLQTFWFWFWFWLQTWQPNWHYCTTQLTSTAQLTSTVKTRGVWQSDLHYFAVASVVSLRAAEDWGGFSTVHNVDFRLLSSGFLMNSLTWLWWLLRVFSKISIVFKLKNPCYNLSETGQKITKTELMLIWGLATQASSSTDKNFMSVEIYNNQSIT